MRKILLSFLSVWFAVDAAVVDVITAVGVFWFPAVVMVSAVAVFPTAVVYIFSTGVSTNSGVLI
jgi:hypothetical protein